MVSQEHIPESGLQSQSTHQTHLCSQSDSGGVGVEKKNRGFGSFGAPFEPQVSPQLSRNSCLLPEMYGRGGVITHQQKQEKENTKLPSSTSASAERESASVISASEHADLSVSTYVTRAVAVNQYLAECCGGIWNFAFNSSPLDRCHCEMDTAE